MSGRGLKIYHVNTRSIYHKIPLLHTLYRDVDVLCCSETWLDKRIIIIDRLVEMEDKTIFRCDRYNNITDYNKKVSGGSVCICWK